MVKDFRYITKRVIIGILIGLFFIMFKSCYVKAATISGVNAKVYFQTQNCDINSSDTNYFNCQDGTSYRFNYEVNTTGKDDTFYPFLLNTTDYYVLFRNMIIQYDFDSPFTIDSNHRSIYMKVGSGTYLETNINEGEKKLNQNWLKTVPINSSNQEDNRLKTPANYNFKPYYCTYLDSNDLLHDCGVILNHENATNPQYWFVFDIPLNTSVKQIRLYLGSYLDYSSIPKSPLVSNTSYYVPQNNNFFYNTWVAGSSNISVYGVLYSNYRTHDNIYNTTWNANNNIGLMWLYKGITYRNPTFNVPNDTSELNYSSSTYTNNSYKWYFSSYSQELQDSINNTIPTIDNELDNPVDDVYEEDWFYNSYDNFSSNYAQGFVGLFNSLFVKPIALITEQTEIDLVKDGGTGKVLNNLICTRNSGRDNIIGDYNPYSIELPFGYSFNLPCPHTDIYPLLKKRGYGFYGNNFLGASITSGVTYSFADIWLTLQHGLLIYFLFVTELNFIKYLLDPSKSEVEVLEL